MDESASDSRQDPDTYLLAVTLRFEDAVAEARDRLRSLLNPGQRKVHWRDESEPRRLLITQTLLGLGLEHLVVVRSCHPGEPQERRRRKCLERVLHELDARDVSLLTAESRGPSDDRRDRVMLDRMRRQKVVTGGLRLDHVPGPVDPLLWSPDAVCGAVTRARTGHHAYLNLIRSHLDLIEIDVD